VADLLKDLKLSIRQLGRTPGFTLSAALVLALGIGLNAAMFGFTHSLAIAGRPFEDPDRIVQLYSRNEKAPDSWRAFSYPVWEQLSARADAFDGVLAHAETMVSVAEHGRGESRRAFASLVSGNYFDVLGVRLAQGRGFTEEENRPGAAIHVVVASHAFWRRSGFDPGLLGKTVRVNERAFTVVGITPAGFTGTMMLFGPELFFPFGVFDALSVDFVSPEVRGLGRADALNLFLVGRLKRGASLESTTAILEGASRAAREAFPVEYRDQHFSVLPLPRFGTATSPSDESALHGLSALLIGMTGAVLLVVCLNLAMMMLARGHARRREFAVRLALGGGRSRIVRQLLIEGFLVATLGGAAGALFGFFAIEGLLFQLVARLPVTLAVEITTPRVIVFGAALFSILATLTFALGPALRNSGGRLLHDLKQQTGDEPPPHRRWFLPRHPVVALQIGLSLALLIAAGLFVQMARLGANVETGLDADETVIAEVDASLAGYDEAQGLAAYRAVEEALGRIPGVRSAAIGAVIPFGTVSRGTSVRRAGTPAASELGPTGGPSRLEDGKVFDGSWNAVGASYFESMGIRLLAGRAFRDAEAREKGAPPVTILNERLARDLFPEGTAVGRLVEIVPDDVTSKAPVAMEVVGVVSAIRDGLFDPEPGRSLYVPFAQGYFSNVHFHVRPKRGSGADLLAQVRAEIQRTAPGLPLFSTKTFAHHFESSLEVWALGVASRFFVAVGLSTMAVALVGIYGVKSWGVSRRSREIGVRLAIGATPEGVRSMILTEGLRLGLVGIALGLALGAGLGQLLDAMFVDLKAFDVATFTLAPLVVLMGVLAASWVPARRATAVDPGRTLRAE
jgi:predicted permease